jgi:hypothetical protein
METVRKILVGTDLLVRSREGQLYGFENETSPYLPVLLSAWRLKEAQGSCQI